VFEGAMLVRGICQYLADDDQLKMQLTEQDMRSATDTFMPRVFHFFGDFLNQSFLFEQF
jgi:hypothetical protein